MVSRCLAVEPVDCQQPFFVSPCGGASHGGNDAGDRVLRPPSLKAGKVDRAKLGSVWGKPFALNRSGHRVVAPLLRRFAPQHLPRLRQGRISEAPHVSPKCRTQDARDHHRQGQAGASLGGIDEAYDAAVFNDDRGPCGLAVSEVDRLEGFGGFHDIVWSNRRHKRSYPHRRPPGW
jgi:hypothetical protein